MYLIVGLGNPGAKYAKNRHNIGFMVVDEILSQLDAQKISKSSFKGELFRSDNLFLLKPLTYMNRSGESVAAVKNFYKIDLAHIIVIHDDLDLALGALRFKRGGSSGGHNGLKSIDANIGNDYMRVRFGIGRPKSKEEVIGYVLSDFSQDELTCIKPTIKKAAKAALALTKHPLEYIKANYSQKPLPCR